MSYSSCDFADDLFNCLAEVGAIHPGEAEDEDLEDNAELQADYALAAVNRLVAIKDAFLVYREALEKLAREQGYSLQNGPFCEADERAKAALAQIKLG